MDFAMVEDEVILTAYTNSSSPFMVFDENNASYYYDNWTYILNITQELPIT